MRSQVQETLRVIECTRVVENRRNTRERLGFMEMFVENHKEKRPKRQASLSAGGRGSRVVCLSRPRNITDDHR